jgi:hypothetical protein
MTFWPEATVLRDLPLEQMNLREFRGERRK